MKRNWVHTLKTFAKWDDSTVPLCIYGRVMAALNILQCLLILYPVTDLLMASVHILYVECNSACVLQRQLQWLYWISCTTTCHLLINIVTASESVWTFRILHDGVHSELTCTLSDLDVKLVEYRHISEVRTKLGRRYKTSHFWSVFPSETWLFT